MVTKKQISDALNEYLGLPESDRIKFEKLDRRDLDILVSLFDDPVELVKRLARSEAEERLKQKTKDVLRRAEKALGDTPRPFGILKRVEQILE